LQSLIVPGGINEIPRLKPGLPCAELLPSDRLNELASHGRGDGDPADEDAEEDDGGDEGGEEGEREGGAALLEAGPDGEDGAEDA
jgi:hypothetical protein